VTEPTPDAEPAAWVGALRRTPQQARSRARLARVLEAAERILVEEGVESLTTTRIASEARVSVGSLYQYLPDKEAIVEALAGRYLAEFEALMDELAERAPFEDPVGTLVDAFAQRYRERPGYRALWFGREMTPALRTADLENKAALAEGLMRAVGLGEELRTQARAGVLIADALLQEAFRTRSPELIDEAKRVLRLYLEDVLH
jgi:AcrR family transcriptional regulator